MTPPWSTALDMGTLSPTKKGHPVKSDPFKVLTTGRGHGTVAGATLQLGVILPPASVKMQSSTVLVRIPPVVHVAVLSPVQAGAGLAGSSSCQARVIQVHVKHDLKAFKRRLAPISIYPYAPGISGV